MKDYPPSIDYVILAIMLTIDLGLLFMVYVNWQAIASSLSLALLFGLISGLCAAFTVALIDYTFED